jgi:hypothetical protein
VISRVGRAVTTLSLALVASVVLWTCIGPESAPVPGMPLASTGPEGERRPGAPADAKSIERRPPPEPIAAAPLVATTAAAPVLTVAGAVESMMRKSPIGTEAEVVHPSPHMRLPDVLRSKRFNPQGQTLSVTQEAQLAQLLADSEKERAGMMRKERAATRAALFLAFERGQLETFESPVVSDRVSMSEAEKAIGEQQTRVFESVSARHGVVMQDWGFSLVVTSEPDGVSRRTIVFYTKQASPEPFVARDEIASMERRRAAAVENFFSQLPR